MCGTKEKIVDEQGFALFNTLIFILFMGLVTITLTRMVVADMQQQAYYLNEKRAFYAAQSGIEYAIRGLEQSVPYYQNISAFNNYTETIPTGNGTQCTVKISTFGKDSIRIKAIGYSGEYTKTIIKGLKVIDVSQFAVYAKGNVKYVNTVPNKSELIKRHAPKMPFFDLDILRNMAKPTNYFPHNLVLKYPFNFATKKIVFVENNLIMKKLTWINVGNFVVGHNVLLKKSWLPFGTNWGTFYLYNPNSLFYSQWMFIARLQIGGLIVNGDVKGTNKPWWFYRYIVFYNRSYINNLLKYSLNGGPLIFLNSSWAQQ